MKKVVVGGTFDLLHKGHKEFLKKADSLGKVKVGLSSDRMAKELKGIEVEKFEVRANDIRDFLGNIEVEEINNSFGFAIEEDFDYIVVSPETRGRAEEINEKRKEEGKKGMEIVEVGFVFAEDDEIISSTRIRNGVIDKDGKLLQ